MAEDLRSIIDSVRSRLQAELDAQLNAVVEQQDEAVLAARRAAEAEAEERWAAKVRAVEEQAHRQTEHAVGAVRAELEREWTAEVNRVRAEAEQRAAEASTRAREEGAVRAREEAAARARQERDDLERRLAERDEVERALAAERDAARREADAERRHAAEQIEEARAALDAERAAERAAPPPTAPSAQQLLDALRDIDTAQSVSETLAAMVQAAAAQAPRVGLFIANADHLDEWAVAGVAPLTHDSVRIDDPAAGIVGTAARELTATRTDDGRSPAFAALPHGRTAVAIPLILDGQPVGVLYGDEGYDEVSDGTWLDVLDVIARHGSTRLGYLTALRTAQAMRWLSRADSQSTADAVTATPSSSSLEEEQSAKRYARLLVSEIKLYNEAAVRTGREKRDLLQRLHPEIERARRLYDERVPAAVAGRADHFHQELVQTLAGGDASLLG